MGVVTDTSKEEVSLKRLCTLCAGVPYYDSFAKAKKSQSESDLTFRYGFAREPNVMLACHQETRRARLLLPRFSYWLEFHRFVEQYRYMLRKQIKVFICRIYIKLIPDSY